MSDAEAYLGAHYELLREDAVKPLRDAVGVVRAMPFADENALNGAVGIYDKVRFTFIQSCSFVC